MDDHPTILPRLTAGAGLLLLLAGANLFGYSLGLPAGTASRPLLFFTAGLGIAVGLLLMRRANRRIHHLYRDPLSLGLAAIGVLLMALPGLVSGDANTTRQLIINGVTLLVAAGALRGNKKSGF